MSNPKETSDSTLLTYYQDYGFNPVPINVEDEAKWELHIAKRNNLYQNHLMMPLSLFNNHRIIEFGCNSGENALHLASLGARLTLVEPNEQVLPRLNKLFKDFGFKKNIVSLVNKDIAGFQSKELYDVVLAECFINAIPQCDKMFLKICSFLKAGGIGVVSFDDRYGSLLEVTRQLILKRVCQLNGITDLHSHGSLELAEELFAEDFSRINASRPFEAWWKDALVNPFVAWKYFWTYQLFIPLLEKAGCEFYSSSPKWTTIDHYMWYKNILDVKTRHRQLLDDWYTAFPFILTGIPNLKWKTKPATPQIVEAASKLIKNISKYITSFNLPIDSLFYPKGLENYLKDSTDKELLLFNKEMKKLFVALRTHSLKDLISSYHSLHCLRRLWGTPCHYISFNKIT